MTHKKSHPLLLSISNHFSAGDREHGAVARLVRVRWARGPLVVTSGLRKGRGWTATNPPFFSPYSNQVHCGPFAGQHIS